MLKSVVPTLLVALLASALLISTTTPTAEAYNRPGEVANVRDTSGYVGTSGWRPRTFWVGDSISVLAYHYGLHKLRPRYEVSAIPGRDVSNLPYYLDDRLKNSSKLTTVVIALGTNASYGWTYTSLLAAVHRIPKRVRVVFVSTYRDPTVFPRSASTYRTQASIQRAYSAWMTKIAAVRAHACVAPWRHYASRHRSVLHDGVHPNLIGIAAYIKIVTSTIDECG